MRSFVPVLFCVLLEASRLLNAVETEQCDEDGVCIQCLPLLRVHVRLTNDVVRRYDVSKSIISPKLFSFSSDRNTDACHAQHVTTNDVVTATNDEYAMSLGGDENCGSIVQIQGDKKKISNSILFYNITSDDFITVANISCLYVSEQSIQVIHNTHQRIKMDDDHRFIDVSLHLHRDSLFSKSTKFSLLPFPSLKVPQLVFVEIAFQPQLAFHNEIQVERCFASYSSNFYNNHTFIDNRCPMLSDKSVKIIEDNEKKMRWQFPMFRWYNVKIQQFYLICNFKLSHLINTLNETCNSTSSLVEAGDFKLSFGPYFVDDDRIRLFEGHHASDDDITTLRPDDLVQDDDYNSQSNHVTQTAMIAGVTSGTFFLIAVIAIGYVMKKKCHVIYRPSISVREDRIQPGFAFVLRSSNDVPLVNLENDPNSTSYNTLT